MARTKEDMKIKPEMFVARTRVRGEPDYYDAMWKKWPAARGKYVVKFLDGPHKDEKYEAFSVAKAKNRR